MTRELMPDEVDGWRCTGSIDELEPCGVAGAGGVAVNLNLGLVGAPVQAHPGPRFIPPEQLEIAQVKLAIRAEDQLRQTRKVTMLYASKGRPKRRVAARFDEVALESIEGVVVEFSGLTFLLCIAG